MRKKLLSAILLAVLCITVFAAVCACGDPQAENGTKYKITFNDHDGSLIAAVDVAENADINYTGKAPERPGDAEFSYVFVGWADENGMVLAALPKATADAVYTARYNTVKNRYTVKFVNGDIELLSETKEYGSAVDYDLSTPEKAETEGYTYTFDGWTDGKTNYGADDSFPAATGDVTYAARFKEHKKSFTVKWNVSGTVTETKALYSDAAVYGSIPEKPADAEYAYTFVGWALTQNGDVLDASDMTVIGDTTYYAVFTTATNRYIVKFLNADGSLLDSRTAEYGSSVAFTGDTPQKPGDDSAQYSYVFGGWATEDGTVYTKDEKLPTVTGEASYTAVYKPVLKKYAVNWNIDGAIGSVEYEYGSLPEYNGTPHKAPTATKQFDFIGWSTTQGGTQPQELAMVTGEVTYYAIFIESDRKFTVTWNVDGEKTTTQVTANGAPVAETEPTKAATAKYTYTFFGWALSADGDPVELTAQSVTDDIEYFAVFGRTVNKYEIKFLADNGDVLQQTSVEYDAVPVFTGNAEKASTPKYSYTFAAWSDGKKEYADLPAVVGDTTYTAVFTATINKYSVTVSYVYDDGRTAAEAQTVSLDYGTLYNKTNSPVSPALSGYLPDRYFFGGYLEKNESYTVTYKAADTWDGTSASSSLSGTGTEADPYIIASAADLAFLSKAALGVDNYGAGSIYKLTTSIDLGGHPWTPIGRAVGTDFTWKYFAGTLDGNGYTIGGLYYSGTGRGAALFCALKGTVKNLVIEGNITAGDRVAAVAYMLGTNGVVENVVSYVNTTTTGSNDIYQGGVVGASNAVSTVRNCVNYGDIVSAKGNWVGGIIGSAAPATVTECVNYGSVTNGTGKRTGGVVGMAWKNSTISKCVNYGNVVGGGIEGIGGINGWHSASTVSECVNFGNIIGDQNGNNVLIVTGGVSGWLSAAQAIVRGCKNYGVVAGIGTQNKIGGIAGYSSGCTYDSINYGEVYGTQKTGGILGDANVAIVSGCDNYGAVYMSDAVAKPSDTNFAFGGIVGSATKPGSGTKGTEITDCNNFGSVSGAKQVGGIVGMINGNADTSVYATVSNCDNYGSVTATAQAGGIVGISNYIKITGCNNAGKIGAVSHFAGIAGETIKIAVANCVNSGDVISIGYTSANVGVGGITGWTTSNTEISECENRGTVTAYTNVGGIAGYLGGGDPPSTATDCTNSGTVTGREHFGDIVGFNKGLIINTTESEEQPAA